MGGYATFRFGSAAAADRAAREVRSSGYDVEPDPSSDPSCFAVVFDAADAQTDVPVGASVSLGSAFDRLEHLIHALGGELDTWQVAQLVEIIRLDRPTED